MRVGCLGACVYAQCCVLRACEVDSCVVCTFSWIAVFTLCRVVWSCCVCCVQVRGCSEACCVNGGLPV